MDYESGYEKGVQDAIKLVESLIHDNCDDHTPFYGACVTCGRVENFDVLPDPDIVIEKLKNLIP